MNYSYIDNDQMAIDFRKHLSRNDINVISMDFEGEFNLHCYGEKLCLIQVFDGKQFFIIDPFDISRGELEKTLRTRVVKLFFDAGSDRMLVYRQYDIRLKSVFDLRILVDVLRLPGKGLSTVLKDALGIEVAKKRKYQTYNWTRRPIAEDAIQYALSDVECLFDLKDVLLKRIQEMNLVESMAYGFAQTENDFDRQNKPRIKKKEQYNKLSASEKAVFDTALDIREEVAKTVDKPPNYVLANEQLFCVARKEVLVTDIDFGKSVPIALRDKISLRISAAISDNLH